MSIGTETYMKRAIEIARLGAGNVSPNPLVGCVIVKDDVIIGEGYHQKHGEAHAELNAATDAESNGHSIEGADVYVTLEPCVHHGKTSPCADMLIAKKIARCFIAVTDPYHEVNGKGIAKLRDAGIDVQIGMLSDEAAYMNRFFLKSVTTGLPYITMKIAVSLDGKIALKSGASKWITTEESRTRVHSMRAEYDAVMVASATVIADDPELTVRLTSGRNPTRIVLDASLRLPEDARIFSDEAPTIVLTTHPAYRDKREKVAALDSRNVRFIRVGTIDGQLDMNEAFMHLGKHSITSILIEPGSTLATSLYRSGSFDELVLFLAPMVLGLDSRSAFGDMHIRDLAGVPRLRLRQVEQIGETGDVIVRYTK